jgi:hypothetical protein
MIFVYTYLFIKYGNVLYASGVFFCTVGNKKRENQH